MGKNTSASSSEPNVSTSKLKVKKGVILDSEDEDEEEEEEVEQVKKKPRNEKRISPDLGDDSTLVKPKPTPAPSKKRSIPRSSALKIDKDGSIKSKRSGNQKKKPSFWKKSVQVKSIPKPLPECTPALPPLGTSMQANEASTSKKRRTSGDISTPVATGAKVKRGKGKVGKLAEKTDKREPWDDPSRTIDEQMAAWTADKEAGLAENQKRWPSGDLKYLNDRPNLLGEGFAGGKEGGKVKAKMSAEDLKLYKGMHDAYTRRRRWIAQRARKIKAKELGLVAAPLDPSPSAKWKNGGRIWSKTNPKELSRFYPDEDDTVGWLNRGRHQELIIKAIGAKQTKTAKGLSSARRGCDATNVREKIMVEREDPTSLELKGNRLERIRNTKTKVRTIKKAANRDASPDKSSKARSSTKSKKPSSSSGTSKKGKGSSIGGKSNKGKGRKVDSSDEEEEEEEVDTSESEEDEDETSDSEMDLEARLLSTLNGRRSDPVDEQEVYSRNKILSDMADFVVQDDLEEEEDEEMLLL